MYTVGTDSVYSVLSTLHSVPRRERRLERRRGDADAREGP